MALTRRRFLGAAAALTIVPRHVLGGPRFVAPSEKINVALIGAGGRGWGNVMGIFPEEDAQMIAVADPFAVYEAGHPYAKGTGGRRATRAAIEKHYAAKTPNYKCAEYEDFRVMLEKEKAIDAVVCATPDHHHAGVAIRVMRMGKHLLCEKPLTHNIWETRQVARVARETGLATQMGNIGHSREGIRQTVEWLWDGAIGTVREVHAWVGADRLNPTLAGRPEGTPPLPEGANWDLWIGPREMRPYHPAYTPKAWRDFWAFGGGSLADFGCHDLDSSLWALELGVPESVEAFPAGITNEEIAPQGEIIYYRFGSRAGRAKKYCDAPVTVTWYDGGLRPPNPPELGDQYRLPGRGVLFVGDKGKMFCEGAGGNARLVPYEKTRQYAKPAPTLTRSKGRLTEIVQLGVLAMRTRKRIEWNAETMTAKGVPEAEPMIKETYRQGWEIEA